MSTRDQVGQAVNRRTVRAVLYLCVLYFLVSVLWSAWELAGPEGEGWIGRVWR